jgi:hypothetical protein
MTVGLPPSRLTRMDTRDVRNEKRYWATATRTAGHGGGCRGGVFRSPERFVEAKIVMNVLFGHGR